MTAKYKKYFIIIPDTVKISGRFGIFIPDKIRKASSTIPGISHNNFNKWLFLQKNFCN
jgi:hypothetical protein